MTVSSVVFIDSRVPDLQDLLGGLALGVQAFVLDAGSEGLEQIADILDTGGFSGLSSISLVGHGSAGELQLGASMLDDASLARHADALAQTGAALAPGGDLQLYACNVASGAGRQFQFPANWSGGIINDVEIDATNHLLFFTVHEDTNFPGSAAANGVYFISDAATGATSATKFTLPGITANFSPGDMTFDPVGRVLYVESEETSDGPGNGVPDDVIYAFQVNSTGTAVTSLLHTFTVGFGDDPTGTTANIGGLAVQPDSPPTLNHNTGETVNEGSSANVITSTQLDFNDADDPDTAITYTLTSLSSLHGTLFLSGVARTTSAGSTAATFRTPATTILAPSRATARPTSRSQASPDSSRPRTQARSRKPSVSRTSDNPGAGDRTVAFTFNDGGNSGFGGAKTDSVS